MDMRSPLIQQTKWQRWRYTSVGARHPREGVHKCRRGGRELRHRWDVKIRDIGQNQLEQKKIGDKGTCKQAS